MKFLLNSKNVFEYLVEQCICTQEEKSQIKVELKYAKNFNLLLGLPQGHKLLVKQERHNWQGKTAGEFLHEWRIQEFLQRFPEISQIRSLISEAIHFDAEHSIIVFNYLNDYRDLMDFYAKENVFLTALAQRDIVTSIATAIGTTLATIHRLTIDRQEYREFFFESHQGVVVDPVLHLVSQLERIGPEIFGQVPADGLKFFALYQRYESLGEAIAELTNAFEPCCLTHNDLKLNNVLLYSDWKSASQRDLSGKSIVRLIDWERSAWGDPAFDLGTLIASYLQLWLSSLISSKAIAIDESLRMATTPLDVLQPSIAAMAIAYFAQFPEILKRRPDFLWRVLQFSGLALIQQILSTIQYRKSFGNTGICMLQVAKTLLCRPKQSIPTVFGIEASALNHLGCSPT